MSIFSKDLHGDFKNVHFQQRCCNMHFVKIVLESFNHVHFQQRFCTMNLVHINAYCKDVTREFKECPFSAKMLQNAFCKGLTGGFQEFHGMSIFSKDVATCIL